MAGRRRGPRAGCGRWPSPSPGWPWRFALVSLVIGPDAYPLPGVTKDPSNGLWVLLWGICFGVAGLMVALERPRNPIGWILLLSALFGSLSEVLGIYGTRALADPSVSWPLGLLAVWTAGFLWFPSLLLPFVVLPQVYPDGKPVGPRWRWALRFSALGLASVTLVLALSTDNVDDWVEGLTLPFVWPPWLAPLSIVLLGVGFVGCWAEWWQGWSASVVRFRREGSAGPRPDHLDAPAGRVGGDLGLPAIRGRGSERVVPVDRRRRRDRGARLRPARHQRDGAPGVGVPAADSGRRAAGGRDLGGDQPTDPGIGSTASSSRRSPSPCWCFRFAMRSCGPRIGCSTADAATPWR